ncbi:hypothetical protein CfE428DRAFT_2782 [Chthoniobacter flavus Ellin428]|uniref:Uncharacterized protein n=1 Tax=Chthoniobacter flavus Ellin428 TaxID=497964 RepID=B4D1J4_9BACT|nr:hypothetical protein CfE428DRAFT_2782 [Chthoniobacter flavus Ellin428]
MSEDAAPWVGHSRQNLPAVVNRGIIDQDELEIAEGLREHALDRLLDERSRVVDRHDDGNQRRVHARPMV